VQKKDIFKAEDITTHLATAIKPLVLLKRNLKESQRSMLIFRGEIIEASLEKVTRVTFVWP